MFTIMTLPLIPKLTELIKRLINEQKNYQQARVPGFLNALKEQLLTTILASMLGFIPSFPQTINY
ncbi:hypothetical protein EGT71_10650 [Atlantibacter subterranea]|uniref:Uncharacterized protein n=1 Tax=Atlantibacter subterraneus TaxID=255519 RepID=A0A427UZU3_9ENTR|nr:hypothetical protein EGK67_12075 [Atlantibacter subterranea]RSE07056.1 hypothetical protein EGT84_06675 [Atlantibacter subterranea]RSE26007.1 hypothetical protein EGT71_10650 [Atlantibacter subterranea]